MDKNTALSILILIFDRSISKCFFEKTSCILLLTTGNPKACSSKGFSDPWVCPGSEKKEFLSNALSHVFPCFLFLIVILFRFLFCVTDSPTCTFGYLIVL